MPLIKPEIQQALRVAGLLPEEKESNLSFTEQLDASGLSNVELADELVHLAKNSQNESLRLRALELAARTRGLLKDATNTQIPNFTIVIQSGADAPLDNPILFPRKAVNAENKPN